MVRICRFNATIVREDDLYIARCVELNISSRGATVASARANLTAAVELFLDTADPDEVVRRMRVARTS